MSTAPDNDETKSILEQTAIVRLQLARMFETAVGQDDPVQTRIVLHQALERGLLALREVDELAIIQGEEIGPSAAEEIEQ